MSNNSAQVGSVETILGEITEIKDVDLLSDSQLLEILACLRKNVSCKDRKYYLKTYRQCFLGHRAVKVLLDKGVRSVELAEAIGNRLLNRRLIYHVTDSEAFQNKKLLYRFQVRARWHCALVCRALTEPLMV